MGRASSESKPGGQASSQCNGPLVELTLTGEAACPREAAEPHWSLLAAAKGKVLASELLTWVYTQITRGGFCKNAPAWPLI